MISKAAEFKNILNGKYKNMYDVDIELYHAMCRLGWKIFKEGRVIKGGINRPPKTLPPVGEIVRDGAFAVALISTVIGLPLISPSAISSSAPMNI